MVQHPSSQRSLPLAQQHSKGRASAVAKKQASKPLNGKSGWLCLRLTRLALNTLAPDAVVSDEHYVVLHNHRVWQCNKAASQAGIKPGFSSNHVAMLLPDAHVLERDTEREAEKRLQLAYWAYNYTSSVVLLGDDCLLLEVGRSLNLFGGFADLFASIQHELSQFRISVRYGAAHTPKAARVLSYLPANGVAIASRQAMDAKLFIPLLKKADLSCLDIEDEVFDRLQPCGFHNLDELMTVPLMELGRRFGPSLVDYLEQLSGEQPDPQIAITPPESFNARVDFAEPIHNRQWIDQQVLTLLQQLYQFLLQRQQYCRRFEWRFFGLENRLLEHIHVDLAARHNDVDTFKQLTDLRLASVQLDKEMTSVELSCDQFFPLSLLTDDLFSSTTQWQAAAQLVDKLCSRLGQNSVYQVNEASEYLPELRNRSVAVTSESMQEEPEAAQYSYPAQPLWLLPTPRRLPQQHGQPFYNGPLRIINGPERVTSHWWQQYHSRDYFIVRQMDGRLLWVYFSPLEKSWYLHGLFA